MNYPWKRLILFLIIVLIVVIFSLGIGSVKIHPIDVLGILISKLFYLDVAWEWSDTTEIILWEVRLPRVLLALFVGASLTVAGSIYQGLFRNPLADPYLIGAAAGAVLGATIAMLVLSLSSMVDIYSISFFASTESLITVLAAYLIARSSGGIQTYPLILSGIALGSFAAAISTLIMIRSDPDLRPILSWTLGSFAGARWTHVVIVSVVFCAVLPFGLVYARILNLFQLNEEHAKQLGVNVERSKILMIVVATLVTATAVSFTGLIGFVGLIAPHTVRLLWGPDYRVLIPMATIIGGGFLVLADLAARTLFLPNDLPVGILTALCGVPFFLYLIRQRNF